jgi:hypothetical protein
LLAPKDALRRRSRKPMTGDSKGVGPFGMEDAVGPSDAYGIDRIDRRRKGVSKVEPGKRRIEHHSFDLMVPRAGRFPTRTWAPRFVGRCFFSESRRFLAIARLGGIDIAPSILERSSCVKRSSKGLTARKRRPYSDCSQITSQMSCLGSSKTLCHSLTHQPHAELSQSLGHRRKLSFATFKSEASFSIFLAMRAWRNKSFDNEIRWSRKLPVRSNSESDRLRLTVTNGSSSWSQDLVSSTWDPNRFVLGARPACFRCFDANVCPSYALHLCIRR